MAICNWRQLHGGAFEGARALVTGGAGFIGSHLSEALIDLGASVVVLDDLNGGDEANLRAFADKQHGRLRFVKGSILDRTILAGAVDGCTYVFHQAALGSVPKSVETPLRFHDVNTTGTTYVLEAARQAGVKRVMFAASSSAYGETEVLPKLESMAVRPKSPYAATKVAGEALLRAYAGCYPIDTASLRYFNIFGPRQNANSAYAAVIASFAKALFSGQRPMIFGDGEQTRDFAFVDNAVHANLLAARSDARINGEVMNIAVGRRVTVNELATQMAKLIGRADLIPMRQPERAGDVRHSLADLCVARETIGYEPVVTLEQGLAVTVEWYRTVMTQ